MELSEVMVEALLFIFFIFVWGFCPVFRCFCLFSRFFPCFGVFSLVFRYQPAVGGNSEVKPGQAGFPEFSLVSEMLKNEKTKSIAFRNRIFMAPLFWFSARFRVFLLTLAKSE